MEPTSIVISTVSDMITAVSKLQDSTPSRLWFRGQGDASWHLEAGVYRDTHAPHERNYAHRFRARAGTRYRGLPAYGEFALWLGIMQHYRLPTRLLDWSRSPLIAAYFAIESAIYQDSPKVSAAIWVLQAHDLNFQECGYRVTPAIEAQIVSKLIDPAFLESAEETNQVLAVMASEHDIRMFVQQGSFTIHSDRTPLDLRLESGRYLTKLTIPCGAISTFAREVEICGMHKGDIYPDLDHLDALRHSREFARRVFVYADQLLQSCNLCFQERQGLLV